jgi:hypothetical protein
MKLTALRKFLFLLFVYSFLDCAQAFAQAPLEPSQMPPRTVFYLIWRGAPSPEAARANALLSVWDDSDLAPTRAALLDKVFSESAKSDSKTSLTREELQEYATLFENPFVLGYISEPEKRAEAAAAASAATELPHRWTGTFFVYDRTGKEALLSKAVLRMRSQEKEPPQISQIVISGQPVLKVERKTSTTYWVETGKFAVSANERSVLEEIIPRLSAKTAPQSSLAQSPAYKEAAPLLGGGLFDFFLRVPNLKELSSFDGTAKVQLLSILSALRLDTVHSLCGRLTLDGAKTHVQAAVLGDAAPGTLFDLWSDGEQAPASLPFASPQVISYTDTQINLTGMYSILKRSLRAAFPQGQQGDTNILESAAQMRFGMPLPDALALFSGEFSAWQTNPSLDTAKQIYFLGIHKKPETLKLLRSIFGDQLTSEREEGGTTFLKLSLGGGQSHAGVAQWNFFNLAVTPDAILGSSRAQTLREAVAQHAQVSVAGGLAASPAYQTARSKYPGKVAGMSFFDFQRVDWQAAKDHWIEEAKAAQAKTAKNGGKPGDAHSLDWLEQVNPQIFLRHLHTASGASWKDAKGLHFEEWIE